MVNLYPLILHGKNLLRPYNIYVNNSIKLTSEQVDEIKSFLENKVSKDNAVLVPSKTKYELLRVEKNDVVYILYTSNKLLIQGEDNGKYYPEICKLLGLNQVVETKTSSNKTVKKTNAEKFVHHEFKDYIGVDEVGVSDYFGGLVSTAFLLNEKSTKLLQELKVQDSKKMDDNNILKIGKILLEECKCEYFYLDNVNYNLLNSKYKNINALKTYVHNKAIDKLVTKYNLQVRTSESKDDDTKLPVVLDKYTENEYYYSQLKKLVSNNDLTYGHTYYIRALTTKAETHYLGVAGASVVARYVFLNEIEKLNKKYKLNFPLGSYGSKILTIGKNFVEKYGKEELKNVAKIDTVTTSKLV